MADKILCVDDELNILLSLQRQLRKQFHLESALGPEKALAMIGRDGPYAVVVSDLQMPGMNGLELLAKVREVSPDTVRIMLTGQADLETAIAAVNQGNIFRFLTNLLEDTLRASVKVLTDVLSLVHPAAFSRATRIHRYVRHMAGEMKLHDAWQFEVAALLSQVGCITLEPGALDRIYTGDEISDEEERMFAAHPVAGGELLAHIPRLEAAAAMIANQNLPYGQAAQVQARAPRETVETGAHLLRAAMDFDRLIVRNRSVEDALAQMRLRARDYDPACLQALAAYVAPECGMAVRVLKPGELRPGMVVDQDVRSKTGLLLLAKGQEVTLSVLGRLRAFAAKVGIAEPVRVLVEEEVGAGLPAPGPD